MAVFSYALVSHGTVREQGINDHSGHASVDEFGRQYGQLLDHRPLPWPDVELWVWAGTDTRREPGFVHVRRRIRGRVLTGVPS